MKDIIERTQKFLHDHLYGSDFDVIEVKYRYEHSLRVANIGLELSKKENANQKVAVLGCLLHDVGKFDTNENIEHGRVSAEIARKFFETSDLTQKEINDICYAIAVHVDGKCGYEYESTLESKIVTDADNIDRYSSCKIQQRKVWELKEEEKSIEKKINEVEKYLKKLKNYLNLDFLETETGNKWFKEKVEVQIHFYNEYLKELRMTKSPTT